MAIINSLNRARVHSARLPLPKIFQILDKHAKEFDAVKCHPNRVNLACILTITGSFSFIFSNNPNFLCIVYTGKICTQKTNDLLGCHLLTRMQYTMKAVKGS